MLSSLTSHTTPILIVGFHPLHRYLTYDGHHHHNYDLCYRHRHYPYDAIIITLTVDVILTVITHDRRHRHPHYHHHFRLTSSYPLSSPLSTHAVVIPIIISLDSRHRHSHHHHFRLTHHHPPHPHSPQTASPPSRSSTLSMTLLHRPPPSHLPPRSSLSQGCRLSYYENALCQSKPFLCFGRRLLLPVFGSCRRVESRAGWLSGVGSECHLG